MRKPDHLRMGGALTMWARTEPFAVRNHALVKIPETTWIHSVYYVGMRSPWRRCTRSRVQRCSSVCQRQSPRRQKRRHCNIHRADEKSLAGRFGLINSMEATKPNQMADNLCVDWRQIFTPSFESSSVTARWPTCSLRIAFSLFTARYPSSSPLGK